MYIRYGSFYGNQFYIKAELEGYNGPVVSNEQFLKSEESILLIR